VSAAGPRIAEFIEAHRAEQPGDPPIVDLGAGWVGAGIGGDGGRGVGSPDATTRRLDTQTRIDIAHWAEEYIARLVENHHGDRHDVRTVVNDLNDLNDRSRVVDPTGRILP
jgi:hypothetical protein